MIFVQEVEIRCWFIKFKMIYGHDLLYIGKYIMANIGKYYNGKYIMANIALANILCQIYYAKYIMANISKYCNGK